MRQVAYFLKSYPAYKLNDLLEEYAIRVELLIDEALKLDNIKSLNEVTIVSIPHLKKEDARRIIRQMEASAEDKDDEPDLDASEKLKQIFNRK